MSAGITPTDISWWGKVFGGSFVDEDNNKITANDPKIVAALEWMASYPNRLGPDKVAAFQSGFGDYMSTQNPLFAGKEGFKQVGEWFIQFQKRFAPEQDIRMIPAPAPDGGRANCTNFGGSVFTIPTGVKFADASWEFIKFLSQDEIMAEFCYNIFNIPPKVGAASEERFTSEPRFQLAVDLLNGENAFGPYKIPVNDTLNARLAEAETSVLTGQATAQEILDRVTEEVQKELDDALKQLNG
ncbi:MAG: extracellular solute-binding protein [Caldilineaceae bacterium]